MQDSSRRLLADPQLIASYLGEGAAPVAQPALHAAT
jgi:hypothetical protein